MQARTMAARSRAVLPVCASAIAALMLIATDYLPAQVPLPMITPRVDTLWTRSVATSDYTEFQASDIGGDVSTFVIAATRNTERRDKRQILILLDPKTGDSLQCVESGHASSIRDVVFADDANVLATAEHGRIKLWSWPDFRVLREFHGSPSALPRVLLSADGRRLYSNLDGVMYDTECGDTLWRFITVFDATKTRPSMTSDERFIVTVRKEYIRPRDVGVLLDAATGDVCDVFYGGSGHDEIASIAISDDARFLAVSRLPMGGTVVKPGSCVVYDREGDSVLTVIPLTGNPDTDGQRCRFLPHGAGLLVYRDAAGSQPGDYLYPLHAGAPVAVWWPYFEQRFTRDWQYQFGANGRYAWVGPFALPRASVALPPETVPQICIDAWGALHAAGIIAADGPAELHAMVYDGRQCANVSVDVINGACTAHAAGLHGPVYITISRGMCLLARGVVMVP